MKIVPVEYHYGQSAPESAKEQEAELLKRGFDKRSAFVTAYTRHGYRVEPDLLRGGMIAYLAVSPEPKVLEFIAV